MPPIDPLELRERSAGIAAKFGASEALLYDLRHLLQDYTDASLRRQSGDDPRRVSFGTPAPVVRAVVNALRKRAIAAPLATSFVLDRLWAAGSREERKIAAELLAAIAPADPRRASSLIETWLEGLDDFETADTLATVGCKPLLQADPRSRLADIRRWLASANEHVRRFGAMALLTLARDKSFHDPLLLVDPLRAVMADSSPEVRKAVVMALKEIAGAGPVEAARFLREYAPPAAAETRWIVRRAMTYLPADLRGEFERALRGT